MNNNSLIRLVEYETMFPPLNVLCLFCVWSVANDRMAEFIKNFHFKITVRADYCIFIIKLLIQLLLVTSSLTV